MRMSVVGQLTFWVYPFQVHRRLAEADSCRMGLAGGYSGAACLQKGQAGRAGVVSLEGCRAEPEGSGRCYGPPESICRFRVPPFPCTLYPFCPPIPPRRTSPSGLVGVWKTDSQAPPHNQASTPHALIQEGGGVISWTGKVGFSKRCPTVPCPITCSFQPSVVRKRELRGPRLVWVWLAQDFRRAQLFLALTFPRPTYP